MHGITSTSTLLAALVLALTASTSVTAFHNEFGSNCPTPGVACSYLSKDQTGTNTDGSAIYTSTVVNAVCGPDLLCAGNGATCSGDAECYNYCGTDGICGGLGALCNGQTSALVNCASSWECSSSVASVTGSCQVALGVPTEPVSPTPSGLLSLNGRRMRPRRLSAIDDHQVRARDLRAAVAERSRSQQQ